MRPADPGPVAAALGTVALFSRAFAYPWLSKSMKYPLEEQDAQADDHQRDAGGGSYSQDLVHPYLRLEAPTP